MIYQITYDILPTNKAFYDQIKAHSEFIFFNKEFFINTPQHKKDILSELESTLDKETESVMVRSPSIYPPHVQKWVDKITMREEKERFERKHQEQLKQSLQFIEDVEAELERQLKEKEEANNGESCRTPKEVTGEFTASDSSGININNVVND